MSSGGEEPGRACFAVRSAELVEKCQREATRLRALREVLKALRVEELARELGDYDRFMRWKT